MEDYGLSADPLIQPPGYTNLPRPSRLEAHIGGGPGAARRKSRLARIIRALPAAARLRSRTAPKGALPPSPVQAQIADALPAGPHGVEVVMVGLDRRHLMLGAMLGAASVAVSNSL